MKEIWEDLLAHPERYELRWVLRALEARFPETPRLGSARSPQKEKVQLDQRPTLAFPSSEIASIQVYGDRWKIESLSFGLWGANGVLPHLWTEFAYQRERVAEDPALRDFVGLFHHRMLSLFYKAWARVDQATDHDRADSQRFLYFVESLAGLASVSATERGEQTERHSRAYFANTVGALTRHPEGISRVLSHFFQVPVAVREFVEQTIYLPRERRAALGDEKNVLGGLSLVGSRFQAYDLKFRLEVGPLPYRNYEPLMLSLKRFGALIRRWLWTLVGNELDWDIQVQLPWEEIPPAQLGDIAVLGRNVWLLGREHQGTCDDPIFSLSYA